LADKAAAGQGTHVILSPRFHLDPVRTVHLRDDNPGNSSGGERG
jgi:hypothetical protein